MAPNMTAQVPFVFQIHPDDVRPGATLNITIPRPAPLVIQFTHAADRPIRNIQYTDDYAGQPRPSTPSSDRWPIAPVPQPAAPVTPVATPTRQYWRPPPSPTAYSSHPSLSSIATDSQPRSERFPRRKRSASATPSTHSNTTAPGRSPRQEDAAVAAQDGSLTNPTKHPFLKARGGTLAHSANMKKPGSTSAKGRRPSSAMVSNGFVSPGKF